MFGGPINDRGRFDRIEPAGVATEISAIRSVRERFGSPLSDQLIGQVRVESGLLEPLCDGGLE